jgi:hypothetical protein
MNHVPMDWRTTEATAAAIKQKFRIEPCAYCGGPEVFSKINPTSRCLRCGRSRQHLAVKQHKTSWRRCALCDQQNMAGVPLTRAYCRECQALTKWERAKRLRWKAERQPTASESANKNGPAFEATSPESTPTPESAPDPAEKSR